MLKRKCDSCEIMQNIKKSKELVACAWYMDNVVCGNKTVKECPVYKKGNQNG